MDSRKDAARRRFDRWSRSYERDRRSRFNAKPQQEALSTLDLQPADRFLDVGCGTGAAVRAAAAVVERAVGVDISLEMISRARELAVYVPRAEFVVSDSEQLPFAPESFTAVLCSSSFHHYPEPARAVAEMARVLEPGGRAVIADGVGDKLVARIADRILRRVDHSHIRLHRSTELVGFLTEAGFHDVATRELWDGGYAIVSGRKT
jgi:ubiquinone/menaquinone biosynthesis C-methylase UbiE